MQTFAALKSKKQLVPQQSLQYCQLLQKYSKNIFRNIWNFSLLQNFYVC